MALVVLERKSWWRGTGCQGSKFCIGVVWEEKGLGPLETGYSQQELRSPWTIENDVIQ
jgi:hypothetical protein